jgi:hypothetical protein
VGCLASSKTTLAEILPSPAPNTTGGEAGALTVAGQWRNFTAFPSILAIAVVKSAARWFKQPVCHGTIFHDINFYSRIGPRSQKAPHRELIDSRVPAGEKLRSARRCAI